MRRVKKNVCKRFQGGKIPTKGGFKGGGGLGGKEGQGRPKNGGASALEEEKTFEKNFHREGKINYKAYGRTNSHFETLTPLGGNGAEQKKKKKKKKNTKKKKKKKKKKKTKKKKNTPKKTQQKKQTPHNEKHNPKTHRPPLLVNFRVEGGVLPGFIDFMAYNTALHEQGEKRVRARTRQLGMGGKERDDGHRRPFVNQKPQLLFKRARGGGVLLKKKGLGGGRTINL